MVDPTDEVAVVGAGVVGCAVAWALAKAGRRVLLIDRAEPATAGASFGNVGHVATEQLQPLPSPQLLLTFWRELAAFDGPLDLPLRRLVTMSPWIARFACAAFHQRRNTEHLAPLVRSAADTLESQLKEIGRHDLLRRNGHYVLRLGPKASTRIASERAHASMLGMRTEDAPAELLTAAAAQAGTWYPDTAHVLDPPSVARAFHTALLTAGGSMLRADVQHMHPAGGHIEIVTNTGPVSVRSAVVCAGAWSAPLLAPFGIHAPLEAERGYHVELPGHAPLVDAPILYGDYSVVVTPMAARLRASSYLEFAGLGTPADPRKPARLRAKLRHLGYQCELNGHSWMGPRPTLPDYLPGNGRAPGPHELFYAVGHQHLGLTLAAVTAELVAAIVTERTPRFEVRPFDLRRFGSP
jgi:glycine/D-amino acid oxidase-like deaminating enzyme